MNLARCTPLALAAALACKGDSSGNSDRSTATVRDSGGVSIVESITPQWTPATTWRVEDHPALDIGGSESDTTMQFSSIRSVHRLVDGGFAVLDAGSYSLRFFDGSGTAIGRVGRKGTGPGEFPEGLLVRSYSCGADTIYVSLITRLLAFATPGRYVREFEFTRPVGRYPGPVDCRGDRWLGNMETTGWTDTSGGPRRDSMELAWYDNVGRPITVIDTFPSEDRTWSRSSGELGYLPTHYGRRLAVAVGPQWMATGIGDSFEIAYWDSAGTLRRIARARGMERPMTSAEIDRYRDFLLPRSAAYPASYRKLDAALTAARMPATLPVFAELRFDAQNNVWVREYDFVDATLFYASGPPGTPRVPRPPHRRWHVLDPQGVLLGEMRLPPRFDVHEVGSDWILGVWRDDLDVERVRVYRIQKSKN